MQIIFSNRAAKDYEVMPPKIKSQASKQFDHLSEKLRHPSLHAKKYDEANDIWQARVNRDYRFYFVIHDDVYFILSITKHPK